MRTQIEIITTHPDSVVVKTRLLNSRSAVPIPAVGDEVAIPVQYDAPEPKPMQQLRITHRVFTYSGKAAAELHVLLTTDSIID